MAGKTLRQLVDERDEIDVFLALNEGELTPETEHLLTENEEAIEKKVERTARYVGFLAGEAATIEEEIKRLKRRKAVREAEADYLKNRVLADALLRLGKDRIDTPVITVRKQLNNPKLDGLPEEDDKLHDFLADQWRNPKAPFCRYVSIVETFKLDKAKLLADAKAERVTLPEGISIVRDESVRIA